jgi:hypothetical protein
VCGVVRHGLVGRRFRLAAPGNAESGLASLGYARQGKARQGAVGCRHSKGCRRLSSTRGVVRRCLVRQCGAWPGRSGLGVVQRGWAVQCRVWRGEAMQGKSIAVAIRESGDGAHLSASHRVARFGVPWSRGACPGLLGRGVAGFAIVRDGEAREARVVAMGKRETKKTSSPSRFPVALFCQGEL